MQYLSKYLSLLPRYLELRLNGPLLALLTLFALAMLAACDSLYTVRVNEAVVFTPGPQAPGSGLFEDADLQGCFNQTMQNREDPDPASVTMLVCPNGGIASLSGIEALEALQQLELSGNRITDLAALSGLKELRVLNLRNNELGSITALFNLPILRFVSLAGNPAIPCAQLDRLEAKLGNSLERPQECVG